jgi:hypothetical protein
MSSPPPPSYAESRSMPVLPEPRNPTHMYSIPDTDDEEDSSPPAPVLVKIDASVAIDGKGNTLVLPAFASPATTSTPTQSPFSLTPDSLATAIISALGRAGVLRSADGNSQSPEFDEDGRPAGRRAVEVHVDASLRVGGEGNRVCVGGGVGIRVLSGPRREGDEVTGTATPPRPVATQAAAGGAPAAHAHAHAVEHTVRPPAEEARTAPPTPSTGGRKRKADDDDEVR